MAAPAARLGGDEVERRGQDLYDRVIKPALKPEDDGKFIRQLGFRLFLAIAEPQR